MSVVRCRTWVVALLLALPALAQNPIPDPPPSMTSTIRQTLVHGLQLLAAGDVEFASGHFAAIRPPRPLKVYVNTSAAPFALRRGCESATEASLAAWNSALPDLVRFEQTADEAFAAVTLTFETEICTRDPAGALRRVCGITQPMMPHNGKDVDRLAVIRVAVLQDGWGTPPHNDRSLRHVIAHELGHVLGLDESSDMGDIMGMDRHDGTASPAPSANDLARLRQLIEVGDKLLAYARSKPGKIEIPASWNAPAQPPAQPPAH